jgi:hypothetical protein
MSRSLKNSPASYPGNGKKTLEQSKRSAWFMQVCEARRHDPHYQPEETLPEELMLRKQ